jgi:hypothetical protein
LQKKSRQLDASDLAELASHAPPGNYGGVPLHEFLHPLL